MSYKVTFSKSYTYDAKNNLLNRSDDLRSMAENFEYDELDRLTRAYDNKLHEQVVKYDNAGNITFKTGVGSIDYNDGTNRISSVSSGPPLASSME